MLRLASHDPRSTTAPCPEPPAAFLHLEQDGGAQGGRRKQGALSHTREEVLAVVVTHAISALELHAVDTHEQLFLPQK